MVVDESVRGDYLGLNNPSFDNTPFLTRSASDLVNYGVALSAANCSAESRLLLRVGLQRHQLPDVQQAWQRTPTLWQYAAAANYRTVFIDAWHRFGAFHSYMDNEEAFQINQFITVLDIPYYTRDAIIADKLIDVLKRDEPMLI